MFGGDLNTAQFAEFGDELAGMVDPPDRPGTRGVIAVAWFFDNATGAPLPPAASLLRTAACVAASPSRDCLTFTRYVSVCCFPLDSVLFHRTASVAEPPSLGSVSLTMRPVCQSPLRLRLCSRPCRGVGSDAVVRDEGSD